MIGERDKEVCCVATFSELKLFFIQSIFDMQMWILILLKKLYEIIDVKSFGYMGNLTHVLSHVLPIRPVASISRKERAVSLQGFTKGE